VLNATPEAVDRFAADVRAVLDEGVIRYTRRQALLRRADRLGIGRFEAALVVAAVEHRHRTCAGSCGASSPVRRRSVGVLVAAVLVVEAAAGLALWVLV
jgi:hypothetical protein